MLKTMPLNAFFRIFLLGISMVLLLHSQAAPAAPLSVDKWKPGHYVKIEDWQLHDADRNQMNAVYKELVDTPTLRGIKVVVKWGRYETRKNGVTCYDFRPLIDVAQKLQDRGKHLILSFAWRAFTTDENEAIIILPNDLRGRSGIYGEGTPLQHETFYHMYAYKSEKGEFKGYNLKLYNPNLVARIDRFMSELAGALNKDNVTFDNNNVLVQVSTTESSVGIPIVEFGSGSEEDKAANTNRWAGNPDRSRQYAGQIAVLDNMNRRFIKTPVVPALNYSRDHVADWAWGGTLSLLAEGKFGLGSPNSSHNISGLVITGSPPGGPGTPPGVLTYYPGFKNILLLSPEIQGLDYNLYFANSSNLTYAGIFDRLRNDLGANYIVWQRNAPYWLGNGKVPSALEFIKALPAYTGDTSRRGGLNGVKPSRLK